MAITTDDRILLNVFTGRIEIFLGRGNMHEMFRVVDSLENFQFLIKDQDGNKVTLSATATDHKLSMTLVKDGSIKVSAQDMELSGLAVGEIDFNPTAAQVDTAGVYLVELKVTPDGDDQIIVDELTKVHIREKVGG